MKFRRVTRKIKKIWVPLNILIALYEYLYFDIGNVKERFHFRNYTYTYLFITELHFCLTSPTHQKLSDDSFLR